MQRISSFYTQIKKHYKYTSACGLEEPEIEPTTLWLMDNLFSHILTFS